ncbi:MAG: hypothetical protein GF384_04080 [Elusimicrobia bacterium]|nr:hypothetical protein [Elusimicrobiota bacterium]MBD3412054.1 hypothetical protein [Elusimicrobiota bacterium]
MNYTILQMREIFHLEFLRWFSRKIKMDYFALKGGVNLRFFFESIRYSEDMDIDIHTVGIDRLKESVMNILANSAFKNTLRSFGIVNIIAPNIIKAKQTKTTQRFKIHLITASDEDLYTKVEFSRRPAQGHAVVESVGPHITYIYKINPVLVSHYDLASAIQQKIIVLAHRSIVQPRDIFDLFLLSSRYEPTVSDTIAINDSDRKKATENIFSVEFSHFKDTVVSFLSFEDRAVYRSAHVWDEIRLKAAKLVDDIWRMNQS